MGMWQAQSEGKGVIARGMGAQWTEKRGTAASRGGPHRPQVNLEGLRCHRAQAQLEGARLSAETGAEAGQVDVLWRLQRLQREVLQDGVEVEEGILGR